jgi:hypothetical protein
MRSGGNFSPEWGYLAPAPSFARTARVVLVATAIGATAGAGVVFSLIDRPSEPEKIPVAARAIVTSVRAEAVPSVATAPTTTAAPATVTAPAKPASRPAASIAAAPPNDKPAAVNAAAPTPVTAAVLPNTAQPAAAQTTPAPLTAAGNSGAAVTASAPASASASAAGEPSNVVDAAPAGAPDSATIMAPEQTVPPKKTKHHASSNKNQFQGLGSIFRRMFASHGSRSYYPNSQ